jgi:hypothetical protein
LKSYQLKEAETRSEGGKPCRYRAGKKVMQRKLVMGQRSQEENSSSTMWELPNTWTAMSLGGVRNGMI